MNLFTQNTCDYCGESPVSEKNNLFFDGFRDKRTGHLVCWNCRANHYRSTPVTGGHIYTEAPEYLVDLQKL